MNDHFTDSLKKSQGHDHNLNEIVDQNKNEDKD